MASIGSADKETWKNATKGVIVVAKIDRKGDLSHEIVRGGAVVHLTPNDRILNSEGAALESLDFFQNGSMVPVRLLDDTPDAATISSNPNLKSEDELRSLFALKPLTKFEKAIAEIDNATTLNRLREIASEGDATVRQVGIIESRANEVTPSEAVTDVTVASYNNEADSSTKPVKL